MEKIDWAALLPSYGDIAYDGADDLLTEIEAVRTRQKTVARMSDGDGNMVAKLSALTEAMSTAMRLEAVEKRAYTIAMPRKHLPWYAPVEPAERFEGRSIAILTAQDIHQRIARHRADTVRLDELTRLRAQDEYQAAKLTAATPGGTDNSDIARTVQVGIINKKALSAGFEPEWPQIESAAKLTRRDILTPAIEAAQRECADPFDAPAVWAALVHKANASKPPLLGVSDEGIKWLDANDVLNFFTLKNLRDRLRRQEMLAKAR